MRAIVNTYLSIAASCIVVFIFSMAFGRGRLNMVHVQNATLAGGVMVGAIADMPIQPYGALLVGSLAGLLSTFGFEKLTPKLNRFVHDTCGVNNLHGMPGLFSGLLGAAVAAFYGKAKYFDTDGNTDRLKTFYPGIGGVDNRDPFVQGGYQLLALLITIVIAIAGGLLTGLLMRIPIFEQVKDEEEYFDDQPFWKTPEDYLVKLTEVRANDELELTATGEKA